MRISVTAVGVDRPGIVAAVTESLSSAGCNIEDSRSAILGGHFAMMLIVALPDDGDVPSLERTLADATASLDLAIMVRPVTDARAAMAEGTEHLVSVYGADRPGIVARVSRALAQHRVNIGDLATHVIPGDPPVYVMVLEVVVPHDADAPAVRADLERIGRELAVEISMHENEAETL